MKMIFTYSLDQVFCLKHKLNLSEGSVYGGLRDLPGWAESMMIDGETYYFASRNKMCEEMPLVTSSSDTMYRHYKSLVKKGVIKHTKVGERDFIHLIPSVARSWNRAKSSDELGVLPTLGKKSDPRKKIPSDLGKISDILEQPVLSDNPLTPKGDVVIGAPIGEVETNKPSPEESAMQVFELFRKEYPGTKRGLKVEWENFKKKLKKIKNREEKLDTLFSLPAVLENQKQWRKWQESKGEFVPQWPHLRTWINQARYTEEAPEGYRDQSQANANGLPWKDWPQIVGWKKCTTPGYYYHPNRGEVHYSEMIANRMAKPSHFPNTAQFAS